MSAPTTSDCNQDAACAHGSSLQRMVRRPDIGEMVIVHNYTPKPFKARVRDYHQCASNCIRVTRAHTTEEWIVMWQHCSPNDQAQRQHDDTSAIV